MNLEEILDLETDALAKTICEYTTDNYIRSYAVKLSELTYPKDERKIAILVDKLFSWYKENIDNIMKKQYIHSKDEHKKSYALLKDIKYQLERTS